jgi:hypothetical protein
MVVRRSGGELRMTMSGSAGCREVSGERRLEGVSNYYLGSDRRHWRTGIPNFGSVRCREAYRGIDVVYYGNGREVEFDFVAAPGADPSKVRMEWEGVRELSLDGAGDLHVKGSMGVLKQHRPRVYQQIEGVTVAVEAAYEIQGRNRVAIRLGRYDRSHPLVIDPVLSYQAGLPSVESALGVAVDSAGNAYVTGSIVTDLNPGLGLHGGRDVYIIKWNTTGTGVLYTTYLGGALDDTGAGVAVDAQGNAYVTGGTSSSGFPLISPYQGQLNNGVGACSILCPFDAFLVRLNPSGAIGFSTFYGGSGNDYGTNVAIDPAGNVYLTGVAGVGTNFPVTAGAYRTNSGTVTGQDDAFVIKTNGASATPLYSTLLGGSDSDKAWSIAVDGGGNAYVTGVTFSADFPTTPGAYRASLDGQYSAFLTKLNPAGSGLLFSTLTGTANQVGAGIAVDGYGHPYFVANTVTGGSFSRESIPASLPNVVSQAVAGKMNSAGSELLFSNNLAGTLFGLGVGVNAAGNAYLTGTTASASFATTADAFTANTTPNQAYFMILDPLGRTAEFSTLLGTLAPPAVLSQQQIATGTRMAIDGSGSAYLAGIFNYSSSAIGRNSVVKVGGINLPACTGPVTFSGTSFPASGGAGAITVSTDCAWKAISSVGSVTLAGNSFTGNATASYTVAPNNGADPRTGAIAVAGNLVQIIQKGLIATPPFPDVSTSNLFADYITLIRNAAITSGCGGGQYCPDQPVTRGQMAALLVRAAMGSDTFPYPATPYFADVLPGNIFFKYIQKLRELGITQGCSGNRYCPDDLVTRGQMAALLIRARFGGQPAASSTPVFADVDANNIFFQFVQKMKEAGITTGCSATQYCPNDTATRGQMAAFLVRTFLTPW